MAATSVVDSLVLYNLLKVLNINWSCIRCQRFHSVEELWLEKRHFLLRSNVGTIHTTKQILLPVKN